MQKTLLRKALPALAVILGTGANAFAQSGPETVPRSRSVRIAVSDAEGTMRGDMAVAAAPYAAGAPETTIIARPLKIGATPTVPEFRVRAWEEATGARVQVFAVLPGTAGSETREEQIASVLVPLDQFVNIAATEKYNARRLTVTAYKEQREYKLYVVETIRSDTAVRPWPPPGRR